MSDEIKASWFVRSGLLVAVALFAACQRPAAGVATPQPTRVVTDDLGRNVTVPLKIMRVVSTAPSVTENIFAVGAGDRLVGVTTFCDYPEEAKAIPKIGDTLNPSIETIVALKPDVVFVSSASQLENFTKVLAQNGIGVYVMNATTLKDVLKDLKRLGELFDTGNQTDKLVADLQRRIDDLNLKLFHADKSWNDDESHIPTPVFVQISREPLFTIGEQSFLTGALSYACAYSVTDHVESAYPKLSKETASTLNPQAIILSESADNTEPNSVFRNSPAMKNGRVYKVNADILSRPGPRLVDAMEQIAKDLHPEKFN